VQVRDEKNFYISYTASENISVLLQIKKEENEVEEKEKQFQTLTQ
jgi:hypothetical protein